MTKRIYTITVPTTGVQVYEIPATNKQEAISKLNRMCYKPAELEKHLTEEGDGDWAPETEWEVEEGDEE